MKLHFKYLVAWLCCFPLLSFATTFTIVDKGANSSLQYCESELKLFLNAEKGFTYTDQSKNTDWIISLVKNPTFRQASFSVTSAFKKGKQYIEISGASESDLLCATYTLLEKLGYTFEITGFQEPEKINTASIKNYVDTIVPAARYRGIRQHINFPMDISSYSIEDAKEYIRNLARMRFNFITFHSYPGMWYEVKQKDTVVPAGNFFYAHRHNIPNDSFFNRYIHNKRIFCIPEIEPFYDNIPVKSKMAVQWLQEVMKESKRVGMKVQLSFEPRSTSTDVDSTVKIITQLQAQFPLVDGIEIMTDEAGGWGPQNTAEETRQYLVSFFGKDVLQDTMVTNYILPKQADLGYIYGQIGHAIKAINTIKERKVKTAELKIGIYCDGKYNIPAYYLAKKYAPTTEIAILPSHGSAGVAKHVPNLMKEKGDWDRTDIYSWLEFDGMMFLQQNGIEGIYNLLKYREDGFPDKQINSIAFNHWRTAENKITARYAALSTLYGAIEPAQFYVDYAQRMGISNPGTFARAMSELGEAFDYKKSNMGFAWLGYWKNGIRFEPTAELQTQLALYETARNELSKCAQGNKNSYALNTVKFLDNRLRATIIFINSYIRQNDLKVGNLSKEQYASICNEVLGIYDDCLKVYAEMSPDRGCEGTLINMYLGPMRAVRINRFNIAGVPMEEIPAMNKHFDSPAPPIYNSNN